MVANGKIPTRSLAKLPNSWSNKGRDEYLTREAYASLSRMIARAVAETGTNFQIYDAYRSLSEQVKWLKEYYEPVRAGRSYNTVRRYAGQRWGQKAGKPRAATPGTSNHGLGISIDVHPGAIHTWLKRNAGRFGWVNDVPSEAWHWSYKHPQRDRYRKEGVLDHAWVQKVVGAEVDGKIGTGTVSKIKAFQKKHGLDVDGKVGPATKKKMKAVGSGKAEAAPAPSAPAAPGGGASAPGPSKSPDAVVTPSKDGGFTYTYLREQWDTQGISEGVHPYDAPVKGIYLHWPGSSDSFKGKSAEELATVLRGYRRDHIVGKGWRDIAYGAAVDWAGRTYQLRGLDMEVGSNGGDASNSEAGSILFLLGTRETPTAEMIAGALGLLAQYAAKYGKGYLRGHRQSPDASTSCPGARIMGLIEDGSLNWSGKPGEVVPGEDISDSGAGHVVEDGRAGTDTIGELQRRLGVKVDGRAAEDTWEALQKELDAPYKDGQISRQSHRAESLGNGIVDRETAWEYTGPNSEGSQTVELLQKAVGVKPDGVWFEKTTLALQKAMNRDPEFLRR